MTKYNARKTIVDGFPFASAKEAMRYADLKLLERAGEIRNLELQPKFEIFPAFTDNTGKRHRAIHYIADFRYYDVASGCEVVEDTKGMQTQVFRIKEKLFRAKYPEIVFEVI